MLHLSILGPVFDFKLELLCKRGREIIVVRAHLDLPIVLFIHAYEGICMSMRMLFFNTNPIPLNLWFP